MSRKPFKKKRARAPRLEGAPGMEGKAEAEGQKENPQSSGALPVFFPQIKISKKIRLSSKVFAEKTVKK